MPFLKNLITRKTILGLLSILVITSTLSPVYAELMSPYYQIDNGVQNNMIQCNTNKVLVESPNGKPACVYDSTALKLENRGWEIVLQETINMTDEISEMEINETASKNVNVDSEIITIQSSPILISEINQSDKIGELYCFGNRPAECIFPTSISVNVPNRVNVGEIFDVTVTPSFELSDAELKEFNKKYPIKSFIDGKIVIEGYEDAEEIWEELCSYNRHYSISNPYNYEPSGDDVSFGNVNLNIDYYPPFNRYLYLLDGVEINKSVTFQMKIDEPVKFLLNTGNTSDDYYKHDFGKFIIGTGTAHGNGVQIYTSISGNVVNLSNVEFVRGESQDDTVPVLSDYGFGAVLPQNPDEIVGLGSTSNELPPFEWIAEGLETNHKGEDPTTYIKRFGLNQTYVDAFLEAYPQYNINTQSFNPVLNWILPQAFGQSSPNLSFVSGKIMSTDPNGIKVPVYGVNACGYDVSEENQRPSSIPIMNGQTPACDITDISGNFRIEVPLTDLQGGSSTPDVLIKVIFTTDDFHIIKNSITDRGQLNRNVILEHSIIDNVSRNNISSPFFDYGTFELPTTQHSSRASYILNSLQPVNDWYDTDVGYDPKQSVINWTPNFCIGVGVDDTSNVLDLQEKAGIDFNGDIFSCKNSVHSALENPHTLRHEYAHQVQN